MLTLTPFQNNDKKDVENSDVASSSSRTASPATDHPNIPRRTDTASLGSHLI